MSARDAIGVHIGAREHGADDWRSGPIRPRAHLQPQSESHVFERLRQVGDKIFNVLDPDRDPDKCIGKSDLLAQFTCDT